MKLQIDCDKCIKFFRVAESNSPILSLIKFQDRGGLFYPSSQFISILLIVQEFVEAAVKILPLINISKILKAHILPKMIQLPTLKCNVENHKEKITHHIADKFLSLLLKNIAKSVTYRRSAINSKPLSRKVLKLT